MIVRFKRFTRICVLKRIGRKLLARFLFQFQAELNAQGLALPDPTLEDAAYYNGLARLLAAPDQLPDRFNEALFAIDEMCGPEGQEQLELAITRAGSPVVFEPGSSREEMALQVWLADPALLARAHNQQRLRRLTTFEYFGTALPRVERPPFSALTQATLNNLAAAMDPWFARHQRGHNTTRVELCGFGRGASPIPFAEPTGVPVNKQIPPGAEESADEFWFLIRHGDSFARAPKVEAQQTEILHYRPERDDVVVYSPSHDEVRINARTKGERALYVRIFGLHLRGREDYFSSRRTYTLEPLRLHGPESLEPADAGEIARIVLREIEIAWENPLLGRTIREADDLFARARLGSSLVADVLPGSGRLARATFDIHFCNCSRPRAVQIRLPNVLKVGRHCDTHSVDRWLSRRGFRLSDGVCPSSGTATQKGRA